MFGKLAAMVAIWFDDENYVHDPKTGLRSGIRIEHIEETTRREREVLDEYSARYVRQLRRRIRHGLRPEKTLLEARPQFLYFKDALKRKQA